ncbi:methylated-DNA--[protein]-cysteine S-methyltransferase [Streptomyces sp. p1417]|uniref:Methylated-DNA--protein-cysteine methyltransferase n=1 Tax=Streptomyces typhae TaxID=2681492 RepID=A0A6L6X285_9ACTN|nr:methylated-DNA--[protein]-cysteine S-methyltransferase [Streptomyces typhae]MVO87740.1 methylated-DNA--[protein]-cysteine S-methyltransferase [Streptomyces typhae]
MTGTTTTAARTALVHTTVESPLGELLLVGRASDTAPGGTALVSLSMPGQKGGAVVQGGWVRDDTAFTAIARQLDAYFAGTLTDFAIEYAEGAGTDFQRKVWHALDSVPYGTTTTYGQLAAGLGLSRAAVRALGTAIGRNPLLVVRPCHRVIGADGSLTGYAGGLDRKRRLLDLESA